MARNNMTALEHGFDDLLKNEDNFFNFSEEGMWDGLWCWNLKNSKLGKISYKLSEQLGYTSKLNGSLSIDFLSLVHQEDLDIIQKECLSQIEDTRKHIFNIDVRLGHIDGSFLWFNLRGNKVLGETQDCQGLLGAAICIDRYKKNEIPIGTNKKFYENIVKGANIGIWEGNLFTGKLVCNDRWADMFGFSLPELKPLNYSSFLERVHPDDVSAINQSLEMHIKKKGVYEVEFRIRHKEGNWVWILSRGEVTQRNSKGQAEIVSGMNYDITSRKTNEILLEKYKDLFERSGEAAKIGYWEVDQQENNIFWSKVTKQIHEVLEDYEPTMEAGLDFYLEGENRERIKAIVAQSLLHPMEFDEQLQLRLKNRKLKWVRVIGISDHSGNVCTRLYGLIQDIDHIKKAQLKIKIREEQFRQTFVHSAIGMALINGENKLLKANTSFCNIFGYSEAELQQMDLENIAHAEDLKKNRELIEGLFRGKDQFIKLDHRFIHKNGSVIWTNISMSAIHNDQGEISHFVSQVQDITERKQNELMLVNYKNLLEQSHVIAKIGSWVYLPMENKVNWSENLIKMLEADDYKPHNLEFSIANYALEKDRERIAEIMNAAVVDGTGFDFETEIITKRKGVIWARLIGVPDFEDGKCIRISGLVQNIDHEKRLKLELAHSEERFRTTFEHAAIGMLVIDLEGRLQKANPKICEILGYSKAEVLEKSIFDLAHPEDMKRLEGMLLEVHNGAQGSFKLEKRCVHKDGGYVWVHAAIAAVKNDAGNFTHLVAQIQDISDKKLLTENLTEHNNRLTNFAHIVSHNLRSHTSNISMLLDLALQDDPNVSKNEYFSNIKLVSDNMNETIYQLNEIVEINSKVSTTLTSQNLLENVERALRSVESLVRKNIVNINLDVESHINVLAVHAYLESIILNLITNAIKYKSPNRTPVINITSGLEGDYAYLSVADNGLGIDMDRHGAKLFGMYKTFHNHPEARGIGLFISKNQIDAMGGKIEVESEINRGSNFTAYFRIC